MSIAGPTLAYRVCPDCCTARDGFTATGVPLWDRNPRGEALAILDYERRRVAECVSLAVGAGAA